MKINQVSITGTLSASPQRQMAGTDPIVTLTVAIDDCEPCTVTVEARGPVAIGFNLAADIGAHLFVTGQLVEKSWISSTGKRITRVIVRATQIITTAPVNAQVISSQPVNTEPIRAMSTMPNPPMPQLPRPSLPVQPRYP